jgi:hypothetical protein
MLLGSLSFRLPGLPDWFIMIVSEIGIWQCGTVVWRVFYSYSHKDVELRAKLGAGPPYA